MFPQQYIFLAPKQAAVSFTHESTCVGEQSIGPWYTVTRDTQNEALLWKIAVQE